jgi:hypothetical protein
VFEALLANPGSRELMRRLLASAGQQFDEATFATQLSDPAYYSAAIAPVLRRMPPAKLAVLADLQARMMALSFNLHALWGSDLARTHYGVKV